MRGPWRMVILGCLALLAACVSEHAPQPAGFAGLVWGDGPPPDMRPVPTVLPREFAYTLAFYRRPEETLDLAGVRLSEPVYAFYQGRFFSVEAPAPAGSAQAVADLTRAFGSPLCTNAPAGSACLWRLPQVDVVVEAGDGGPARVMVRYRPIAGLIAAKRGQAVPREGEGN